MDIRIRRKRRRKPILRTILSALVIAGCAATTPYVGQGPHRQVTRGAAIPPVDFIGNVLSVPAKVVLWNRHFNDHSISEATEERLTRFLDARDRPAFKETRYRLNQYAPIADLHALITNHYVAWPYRLLLGFPLTVISDVLLPGRIFPWGDYYNPYTNTAHLYSDDPAIAIHEAGHAYDFADFPYKGTYAMLRLVPFMDLYQEWRATDEATGYFVANGDREMEFHAYRTLWPAYGTYIGSYIPAPFSSIIGAVLGHVAGRSKVVARQHYYKRMDAVLGRSPQRPEARTTAINQETQPEGEGSWQTK